RRTVRLVTPERVVVAICRRDVAKGVDARPPVVRRHWVRFRDADAGAQPCDALVGDRPVVHGPKACSWMPGKILCRAGVNDGDNMKAEDLILVSVDDHLVEPTGLFDGRLPAKYVEQAPRVVHRDDGSDVWVFDDTEIPNIGLN